LGLWKLLLEKKLKQLYLYHRPSLKNKRCKIYQLFVDCQSWGFDELTFDCNKIRRWKALMEATKISTIPVCWNECKNQSNLTVRLGEFWGYLCFGWPFLELRIQVAKKKHSPPPHPKNKGGWKLGVQGPQWRENFAKQVYRPPSWWGNFGIWNLSDQLRCHQFQDPEGRGWSYEKRHDTDIHNPMMIGRQGLSSKWLTWAIEVPFNGI